MNEANIDFDNNTSNSWVVADKILYTFLESRQNVLGSIYKLFEN